jgi:AcrR family transcriptional regulator
LLELRANAQLLVAFDAVDQLHKLSTMLPVGMMNTIVRKGWERRHHLVAMNIEVAALQKFIEHGDEHFSVQAVADSLELSKRTFYRYYPSINDALVAAPLRSLRRIRDAVKARPLAEPMREAFLHALNQAEGSQATELVIDAASRHPLAWRRVVAQMQPTAVDFFEDAIADRLRRDGRETRFARLAAGILVGVIENQEILVETRVVFRSLEESMNEVFKLLSS